MAKARKIKGIDCHGGAIAGIQQAVKERFDEMCSFRADALNWKDPEGVHSMRVASRRIRSTLRSFMPYLNKRSLAPIVKQIKSIADALGEVRDQDVAIQALEDLSAEAPKQFSSTLERLIESRNARRDEARHELKKTIAKDFLKELSGQFEASITSAFQPDATANEQVSEPLYIDVARTIIGDRLDELEHLSHSLFNPDDPGPLHEMRIAAKRLRYAIELFAECLPSDIEAFAKEAAHLQTELGQLHDCDVWIADFRKRISGSRKLSDRTDAEAFVWLFTHYQNLRNKHYQEAFSRWSSWRADNLSAKLQELLQTGAGRAINSSGSASASSSLPK